MKKVFKRTPIFLCTLLFASFMLGHAVGGYNASPTVTAKPTQQSVRLFANRSTDDFTPIILPLYAIDGNNYAKLRDVAQVMDFGVVWDKDTSAIKVTSNNHYDNTQSTVGSSATQNKTATLSQQPIYIDGKLVDTLTMYAIDGNNYIKLRDIAGVVNFGCRYDATNNAIMLCKESQYSPYDMWGSIRRIVYVEVGTGDSDSSTEAESGNENYTAEQAAAVAARRDVKTNGGYLFTKSMDTNNWTGLVGFDDFSFVGSSGVNSEVGSISEVPIWLTEDDIAARKDYYAQASAKIQSLVDQDAFNAACQAWEDRFLVAEKSNYNSKGMATGTSALPEVVGINPFYRYATFKFSYDARISAVSDSTRLMGGSGYPSIGSINNPYNALDRNIGLFTTKGLGSTTASTKKWMKMYSLLFLTFLRA